MLHTEKLNEEIITVIKINLIKKMIKTEVFIEGILF
jgi:hypothetical protein